MAELNVLLTAAQFFYSQVQKAKLNTEECRLLASHLLDIHKLISSQCKNNLSPELSHHLTGLAGYISELTNTLESLRGKSWLKRFFWADDVSQRVRLRTPQLLHQNEKARVADNLQIRATLEKRLEDSDAVLKLLGVRTNEIPEAKIILQKLIQRLPKSPEKRFFEQGLYALQSCSGHFDLEDVDEFSITSLEVLRSSKHLGTGGFGVVSLGRLYGMKLVAIKELDGVPEQIVRQEIKTWKRLKHPHIVEFFGAAPFASPPFIVCDYMANGDAMGYIKRNPGIDRTKLLHDASVGLVYIHNQYVIHGDLKASNILIDDEGRARISDFGLSVVRSHTSQFRQTSKRPGPLYGTAPWMAPELLRGERLSIASDVYGFAMTMYEIYSETPPFASIAGDPRLLMASVVNERNRPSRPEPSPGKTPLHDEVWHVMVRAWSHEPQARPKVSDIASILARRNGNSSQHVLTGISPDPNKPPPPKSRVNEQRHHRRAESIQVPIPAIIGVPIENVNGHYTENAPSSSNASHSSRLNETTHPNPSRNGPSRPDTGNYFLGGWQDPSKSTLHLPQQPSTPALINQPSQSPLPSNSSSTTRFQKPPRLTRPHERLYDYFRRWTDTWDMSVLGSAFQSTLPDSMVNEVALTVWTMQMYKRRLRHLVNERLDDVIEVFTVPPHFTSKINNILSGTARQTGERQGLSAAAKILGDLWAVIRHSQKAEPKTILIIGPHWQQKGRWLVHKVSMVEGNICSYETVNNESPPTANELPSGWWAIIRTLWPHVRPRPSDSNRTIYRSNQPMHESSLSAAAIWRNLLQEWRPDREADLHEIRSSTRREVECLLASRFHPEYAIST
ncbi:unnamed protein product [Somion occarium]|uniref:Protein kinase domain-containing protein n=1 Tax=Somion occarium TaxID=3059160 RepID=A0ABP1D954_9APHY